MAVSISSSMGSGVLVPAPFCRKAKGLRLSSILFSSSVDVLRRNRFASKSRGSSLQPWVSRRRWAKVHATILQEDEEKVVVEKSFDPKSFPEKENEGTSGESYDGSPTSRGLEKWIIKFEQSVNIFLTESVIKILDSLYHDRHYARFYVLETIARVPYFAFMSVLHMYESFGWWRRADYLKVHFAESWNEMHHLLIMEELGGNSWWVDRFLAQHIAIFYYFMTAFMYALSPRMAYHFSECVESHAFETYDKFIKTQKDELKKVPAPVVAVKYYTEGDLYLFDEFQTSRPPNSRRPKIDDNGKYDDDEGCVVHQTDCQGIVDCIQKSLLMKSSNREIAKNASPTEQLRRALEQGCQTSVKDLSSLLSLISEKKDKMEQQEAETNLQILFEFMLSLRMKKVVELNEIQDDLHGIKEDIEAVERRRLELCRMTDRYSSKKEYGGSACLSTVYTQNIKADPKSSSSTHLTLKNDAFSGSDTQNHTQSGIVVAKKRRVHAQFNDLQEYYLQRRRYWASQMTELDLHGLNREGLSGGLEEFNSVLSTFTRYGRLRVVAEIRHEDLFHSANNIISSIEFDRDDELFATAGVSRRIKIFDFAAVLNGSADEQFPIAEMSTRSKLSCVSWNRYTKNQMASSDYEGIITVWDVNTRQSVMEYEEHEKRAWSVDYSSTEPSMLVSGSDDCKVKVWCTKQETSALNIDMKANICSVKYNPWSNHIAVGSANHHIHYFDLRKTNQPVISFSAHKKAVSYVKFMSNTELASASTDNTLRLWDVNDSVPVRTYKGHTNEKNFVGLAVNEEYIACGSETNEVYVYHKAIARPAVCHKFDSEMEEADDDPSSYFISAVCWKSHSPTVLTANSRGTIKVLVLAA
ncbi:E3 ubiquitin-protein ligase COP1 [Striga hermonthica]|uniref:Ubiquinol oxidase n=1 Tax=Striga hermonthica TaxID=68872 RepID=A0A9N7MYS3_STRHE|nr:E3 ubiquitin-protein ligase COP1 [Striga hermonthica]